MELFLWLVGITIVLGVLVGIFQVLTTGKKKKAIEELLASLDDFSATQHVIGENAGTGIALDEQRKRICLIDYGGSDISQRTVSYKDVLSCEIFEDGETVTKTSRSSQVGGALIGGLALGGVGAIIGGLSGKTKSQGKVKRVDLRLVVNDTSNPLHDVNFMDIEGKKDGLIYTQAIAQARHWHGLVSVLIKQADAEDLNSSNPQASGDSANSIADELKKLSELRDTGILTEEEFRKQKERLLT